MTDTTNIILPDVKAMPDPNNPSGWKYRRFAVFVTLAFCYALIALVVIDNRDNELGRLALITLSGLAGSTLGSYVFGAAWERTKGQP